MTALRVFVVDDEAPARRKLLRFLAADSEVEVVGEAVNGREAVAGIRRTSPDLLLLDVQMPDFDGFEVVKQLAPPLPRIVFVTAFDQYAIQAFAVRPAALQEGLRRRQAASARPQQFQFQFR
jgi:DNA-binding LytR/AlgR family response regulator